jgi:hypothetical protein
MNKTYTLVSRPLALQGVTAYLMVMPHKFGVAQFTDNPNLALTFNTLNEALQVAQNIGELIVIEHN